ncbi:hypothetical protein AAFF_G00150180 [Aldrovandia affinis]|uniref:Uncharacterized protein n=1 Tax=Aldrovandia affinis TaxID=143900 RepID=A0AAD7R1F4_9TELE|nr:hypothetical protein AAFF_G00150180 [Aldrovandia affinis]
MRCRNFRAGCEGADLGSGCGRARWQWVLFFSAPRGHSAHCIGTWRPRRSDRASPSRSSANSDDGSIDPMVHVDESGAPHLLWKVDANAIGRPAFFGHAALSADGTAGGVPSDLLAYEGGWEYPLMASSPELVESHGVCTCSTPPDGEPDHIPGRA